MKKKAKRTGVRTMIYLPISLHQAVLERKTKTGIPVTQTVIRALEAYLKEQK